MNKLFYRTKSFNGFLISDADLTIENVFYPPLFDDSTPLDIGNNDPLKLGAIASKIISGLPILFIYQGLNVDDNQIWIEVGKNDPSVPDISLWNGSPINDGKYATHPIDGTEYLFRSTIDGNISEPTLDSGDQGAWTQRDDYGQVLLYDPLITYNSGDLVRASSVSDSPACESINDGNIGNAPPTDGTSDSNWRYVGKYKTNWISGRVYDLNDIVYDHTSTPVNRRYISNEDNNTEPLSDHAPGSTWVLIGPRSFTPDEPLTFTQANLIMVDEGNYSLSFNLPVGKSIISIERLQDGVISRSVPISNAFTIVANNPNTTIEGFDNNAAQTITIKIS